MAKIKMVYKPPSKDEQEKFDKAQQEFYEYIKSQKGEEVWQTKKRSVCRKFRTFL